jgi:gluconolactonase
MSAPRLILRSACYSEGCVVDADGDLYFSETAASRVWVCSLDDEPPDVRVWSHIPGANGHAIADDGSHIVMSSTGAIVRCDESGRIAKVIATHVDGDLLVYPNDVALDPYRGGFFCTDSGYKETPKQIDGTPQGRIVRVDADDRASVVADGIAYANGIALSPDGRHLFITESTTKRLWTYEVRDDGSLGTRTLLAETPASTCVNGMSVPDGATIGPDGRLYVAHYGAGELLVYESGGRLAARIPCGNRAVSHVAFGSDGGALYVSGGIESERGEGAIFAVNL